MLENSFCSATLRIRNARPAPVKSLLFIRSISTTANANGILVLVGKKKHFKREIVINNEQNSLAVRVCVCV